MQNDTYSSKEICQILKLLQRISVEEKTKINKAITTDPLSLECNPKRDAFLQEKESITAL